MGIIREDGRPRDWGYIATVPLDDLPLYQKMACHVQRTHDIAPIEEFNEACERHDKRFITVTKAEDLVVTVGLQQCINIILGTSSTRWRYVNTGLGTTAPSVANTTLGTEISDPRIDMTASGRGWTEARGMKLFFGAIGAEDSPTTTTNLTEFGIFTATTAGTMLNREVFANNPIAHVGMKLVTIISSVIEFCPVA